MSDVTPPPPTGRTGGVRIGDIAGGIHNSIVAGRDVITQYINHPPTLYSDLRTFLGRYRIEAVLLIAVQGLVFYLYKQLEGPYLLSQASYTTAAFSLAVALITGTIAIGKRRSAKVSRGISTLLTAIPLVALLFFAGTVGVQAHRVLYPFRFEDDEFGIAVATFSHGAPGRTSKQSYEISSLIENKLHEGIRSSSNIRVIRIGTQANHEVARSNPHHAKLVIWGVVLLRTDSVDVRFTLLPTEALIDTPQSPQPIPVFERELEFSTQIGISPGCVDQAAAIERQSIGIAAFSLGLAHFYNHRLNKAVSEFVRARQLMTYDADGCLPDEPAIKRNLSLLSYFTGKAYQLLGKYETSQQLFEEAAVEMADDPALIYAMIYNYRVFGQEQERKNAYQRLIEISSNPPEGQEIQALYDRALAHEALGHDNAALDDYEAAIAKAPDFFVAYLGAGGILVRQKKYDEALGYYERAEALTETNRVSKMWLLLYKGLLYETRNQPGDLERARDLYIEAIELDTSEAAIESGNANSLLSLHFYLANVYSKLGNPDLALIEFQTLAELASTESGPIRNWAYSALADFQFGTGNFEAAISNYEKALETPAYSDKITYARLGQAYARVGREHEAIMAFESALNEPGGGNEFVHFEYGVALFNFGRHADGIDQMETALALEEDPTNKPPRFWVKARLNLGLMYKQVGNTERAKSMFASLVEHCDLVEPQFVELALQQLEELGATDVECRIRPKG